MRSKSSPQTRSAAKRRPSRRWVARLSRHRPDVIRAWGDRIRACAPGRRLARAAGEAAFQRALARVLSALEGRPRPASPGFTSTDLSRLLAFLKSQRVDPAWLARWCAALFGVCRERLHAGGSIARRDLPAALRALEDDHARAQATLLRAVRVPGRRAPVRRTLSGDRPVRERLEASLHERTEALAQALEEYRDLVERLDVFVFTIDEESRIASVTGKGLQVVGLEEADVLGKPIQRFVPPNLVKNMDEMRRRLLAEKRLRSVTISIPDARGEERVVEINVWLLERQGRPVGALAVARDLTPQARLEEAMRETRLRLERIIESSADGIVTTDREGNVTMFSRGAEEMLGYSAVEVMNKPIASFLASTEPGVEPLFRSMGAGGGRTNSYETVVRARDGREVAVNISASVLRDESGELVGYLGICKDITARRRAEEDLRRKNEELEAYVRTVSHDLRGPLVAVQGFCSLLEETCGAQLPETGRYFLDRVKGNARQMDHLISELLELSTAGQATGACYWVPARSVLQGIAEDLAPLIEGSGARLEIQGPIPQVLADEVRLQQVFANLIGNAAKHMGRREGGTIEVSAEPAERGHVFCVADNGVGIDPGLHERIFEMFYTRPTNGEGRGFGLGLPIVRKIVEAHGGRVWVESEPECGARFFVHFPDTKA